MLSISLITDDTDVLGRAWDVLTRVALGLTLEGIQVNVNSSTYDDDDSTIEQDQDREGS